MGFDIGRAMIMETMATPNYTYYNIESYFTKSLELTNQFNEEMRMYHLEFYNIDSLNESIQSTIISKIGNIFKNIIAFIKKIKDAILSAIREFKRKLRKKDKEDKYHLGADILKNYQKEDYFTMSIYSNTLSDAFLNKNDPPIDLDFIPERKFESMQDFIFAAWDGTPNAEEAIKSTNDLLEDYKGIVNDVFYKLAGTVKESPEVYKDKAKFKEILTNKYIGTRSEKEINNVIAVTASTNMEVYDSLINNFDKMYSSVNTTYNKLEGRLDKFRTNMFSIISNPEKHTSSEEYQKMVTKIATMAIAISSIITDICNMHLNSIGIKLDCINTMLDQDNAILDRVKRIINKGKVNESFIVDTDDSLDMASRGLYEACLNYQDALSNLNFVNELSIITEADGDQQQPEQGQQNTQQQTTQQQTTVDKDQKLATNNKSSIKDRAIELFRKAVENLKNMWNKFLEKVKQFTERPWLQNNKDALLNLQLPKSNEGLEDWTTFNTDLIKQKLQLPVFDPNNSQLMNDLESDDTFSKVIYKAIGGNFESKIDSDASYIDHCKGLYGIKENDGKIGLDKVQPMIKDMVEYCEQFLSDGSNSITASIRNDMQQLDRSKKIIEQAIKEEKKNISDPNKKTTNTTSNTTTQQQAKQDQQQSSGNDNKVDESFSAAAIFGLIGVNEVKMPNDVKSTSDIEKTDQKQTVKNANDGTVDTMNKIDEKAMRYFRMVGNAIGARMTQSVACYRQYISVLKWAMKLNQK